MRFLFFFILVFLLGKLSLAQNQTFVFHPVFGNSDLRLSESYYKLNEKDSLQIETLKFYISDIEFLNEGKIIFKEKNSFHLVDASNDKSLAIVLKIPSTVNFTQIRFNLGIDSITNVSGALGGDLDPTKGMYWTWQSGYVNFKLEGKSNLCKTRNNVFQFHLGGYQKPFYALQSITLDVNKKDKIEIFLDISKLISTIDLSKENEIMSPGKDAVLIAEKVKNIFSVKR